MDNFCDNKIQFNKLFPLPPFKNNVLENTLNERTIEKQIGKLSAYTALIPLMPYDIDIKFETPDNEIGYFTGKVRANIGEINVNITFSIFNYPNVEELYLVYDFVNCEVKITAQWDNRYMLLYTVYVNTKNNVIITTEEHNIYYKRMIEDEKNIKTALDNANNANNRLNRIEPIVDNNNSDITKLKANDVIQDNNISNLQRNDNKQDNEISGLNNRVKNIEENVEYNDLSVYATKLRAVENLNPDFSNVVFIGDENIIDESNTGKNGWAKYFIDKMEIPEHKTFSSANLSFNGINSLTNFIATIEISAEESSKVKSVFLSLGLNDMDNISNGSAITTSTSYALNKVIEKFPNATIYYLYNTLYSLCDARPYRYIIQGIDNEKIINCSILNPLIGVRDNFYTNDTSPTKYSKYFLSNKGSQSFANIIYNYFVNRKTDYVKYFVSNVDISKIYISVKNDEINVKVDISNATKQVGWINNAIPDYLGIGGSLQLVASQINTSIQLSFVQNRLVYSFPENVTAAFATGSTSILNWSDAI